ncbi:MAG: hypothetical protein A2Y76_08445 [Planctomycetes bacterium RBG_13_60_9]|nr:MAG: hypothetical protein A2Y76_08445 [Planctomycetes bacterium RBG_13_60_9]
MFGKRPNPEQPEKQEPQPRGPRDDFKDQLKRIRDEAVGDLKKSLGMPREDAGRAQPNDVSPGGGQPAGRSPRLSGNMEEDLRARASGTAGENYLTGQAYLDHKNAQEQDDAAKFKPRTEKEFNTDIRRLEEEKLRQRLLPPVASEYRQSVGRERQILDAYKRLGYVATDSEAGSVSMNYPDTRSHEYRNTPSHWSLKEAFRAGYRDKQEGRELSTLTEEDINDLKAQGAVKAKDAMQRAQRARRSETCGSGGDMPRAARTDRAGTSEASAEIESFVDQGSPRPSDLACPTCGRMSTQDAIFCLDCGEDLSDAVVYGHGGPIQLPRDPVGRQPVPRDDPEDELHGRRSETAKPSGAASGTVRVTGQPLVQHRQKRQDPEYAPQTDADELMDAKDAGQYHRAATAGGMSESANGTMGLDGVRRIYYELGQQAARAGDPKGEVGKCYPRADPSQVEKDMVNQTTAGMKIIKEAFKDGYTGRPFRTTPEMLQEQQGRNKGTTARPSGIVGSLWNKLRGSSESGLTANTVAGVRGSQTEAPEAAYARKLLHDGHLRDGDIDAVLSLLDSNDQGAGERLKAILAKYHEEGIGLG